MNIIEQLSLWLYHCSYHCGYYISTFCEFAYCNIFLSLKFESVFLGFLNHTLLDEILDDKNVNLSNLQSLANLPFWTSGLYHLNIWIQFVQILCRFTYFIIHWILYEKTVLNYLKLIATTTITLSSAICLFYLTKCRKRLNYTYQNMNSLEIRGGRGSRILKWRIFGGAELFWNFKGTIL